jgi:hypothetical protein
MHSSVTATSNLASAQSSWLRQSAFKLGAAIALTVGAMAVNGQAAAQSVLLPSVKASGPLPTASGVPTVRPSKRAKGLGRESFEAAQRSTVLCVDIGDPGCGGEPEGWSRFWTLDFRFPFDPDKPPELEKVTVFGARSTCYIWMTGVSGEDIQVVLPTCGLGDAMGIAEIAALSPGEFQALEVEVERLAKVVQKCVKAPGSRANDTSNLWSQQAAKTDLDGMVLQRNDVVVVRYASGEIYAFNFGGKFSTGEPVLTSARPASADERAVCVVAG